MTNRPTRRDFLFLSLAAALDAWTGSVSSLGASQLEPSPSFAKFHELAPGSIQPEGWLHLYLQKQATSLAFSLPDVSMPFSSPFWQGQETGGWAEWEQNAYWIDGATRCALANADATLMQRPMERIRYTLAHPHGPFLGPQALEDPQASYGRWPHAVLFRSLSALSDAGSLPDIPKILTSFYLSDAADYAIPARNIVNVETMLWCYGRTGNRKLLELAETSWKRYVTEKPHDPADLSPARVYANVPIKSHGVTYAEVSKLPAILYAHTGDPEYLKFAIAAQQRIFDHHMLVDGIPSTSEFFRTTTSLDAHETCDITDHTWSWGHFLVITGDGSWGDRIERACFNAGMGAIRKDWKGLQYFSCPNQILATLTSNHCILEKGNYRMAYQPNPGRGTACCGGNVHRLFPNYALRMWMKTADKGMAAVLYGPSSVQARLGDGQELVRIDQETAYPFEEEIRFTIHCAKPVRFPLSLRIPGWCTSPRLQINGHPMQLPVPERGFATIARKFHSGNVITLSLPMQVTTSHWPASGIAFERGPLVYSRSIDTNWTSSVIPEWSTEEFPAWEAKPVADWNFGVPETTTGNIKFSSETIGPDPWKAPPVSIEIAVQRMDSWKPAHMEGPNGAELTPELPLARTTLAPVETIKLVPYGSTQLRITTFPKI
jgi:hypothetical protein